MTIKQVLELFKYNWKNKIGITMNGDCGERTEMLEPTLYKDIKLSQIKDLLDYKVYSLWIEYDEDNKPYFEISFSDPDGEWK